MVTNSHNWLVAQSQNAIEPGVIEQAQRVLGAALGVTSTEALRELRSQAATDEVSLHRAASRIVARARDRCR